MKNYRVLNALLILIICASLLFVFKSNSHIMLKVVAGLFSALCIMLLFNLRKPLFAISQFVNNHLEAKEITFYIRCLNYVFLPLIVLLFIAALLRNMLQNHTAVLNVVIQITLLVIILVGVYMLVRLFISTKSSPYFEINIPQEEKTSSQEIINDSNSEKSDDASLPEAPLKNIFPSDRHKLYVPFIRLIEEIFFKSQISEKNKTHWWSACSEINGGIHHCIKNLYNDGFYPVNQDINTFIMKSIYDKNGKNEIELYPQYCEYFNNIYSIIQSKGYSLKIEQYNEFKLLCVIYIFWIKEAKDENYFPKIPDELNDKSLKKSLWDKLANISS